MGVLIVTEPDDLHAVLVKLALKERNKECDLFFSADMPSLQENSLAINNNQVCWHSSFKQEKINLSSSHYSTIWWRRPRHPFIAKDSVHPEDVSFVNRENQAYFYSLPYFFAEEAWWVNPISAINRLQSKPYQLKLAQQCGFNVPVSFISNSPADIRKFIRDARSNEVVYKPFSAQHWHDETGVKSLYTQKIQLEELPSDDMMRVVPGIYQHYIEKKHELRITCFGSYISAIKIDSQKNNFTKTDWRFSTEHDLGLEEVEVPQSLKQQILFYMKKMNMVFGCFDFIVTPDEDYVFLEVNEQGQFLWVEEVLPQTHYLDIFCHFLIHKKLDCDWKLHEKRLFITDFIKEAHCIREENIQTHISVNELKRTA